MSKAYDIDPSRIPAQLLSGIGFIGAGFYLGGIATTLIVYIILSYSYKISDRLNHFDILGLEIKINDNVKETLTEIEECLSHHQIEIKQIKSSNKEEGIIHIVGHYNKRDLKKNEIMRNITNIENVVEVIEDGT